MKAAPKKLKPFESAAVELVAGEQVDFMIEPTE